MKMLHVDTVVHEKGKGKKVKLKERWRSLDLRRSASVSGPPNSGKDDDRQRDDEAATSTGAASPPSRLPLR